MSQVIKGSKCSLFSWTVIENGVKFEQPQVDQAAKLEENINADFIGNYN